MSREEVTIRVTVDAACIDCPGVPAAVRFLPSLSSVVSLTASQARGESLELHSGTRLSRRRALEKDRCNERPVQCREVYVVVKVYHTDGR